MAGRLPPNRPELTGPFDTLGDVHGCLDELQALLALLAYQWAQAPAARPHRRVLRRPVDRGGIAGAAPGAGMAAAGCAWPAATMPNWCGC
jgi:hypothetical protein